MRLKILDIPTNHCKICFKEINEFSFSNIFSKHSCLCEECFAKFRPKFIKFKHHGKDCLSLYQYDENIKELLYKFKGCYDVELKDVFFNRYLWFLRFKYMGYKIVCLPSTNEDDELRGFNHVIEISKLLKLEIVPALEKTKKFKQADSNFEQRKENVKYINVSHLEEVKNKRILIVDDVFTTGASIGAAIKLIEKANPKNIKVLVVSKNELKDMNDEY